jgi:hypothetical protein
MRMPAMGVRSSCAASAVNCRSVTSSSAMRVNKSLSALTSGSTSGGTPAVGRGTSDCGWRTDTAVPNWRSGRTRPRTTHQMPSASRGSAKAMGLSMPTTLARTMSWRADCCSPTRMFTSPSCPWVTNTRQDLPAAWLSAKPRPL